MMEEKIEVVGHGGLRMVYASRVTPRGSSLEWADAERRRLLCIRE